MDRYKEGRSSRTRWSGAISINDNVGTYGQVAGLEIETPRPENLGLPRRRPRPRRRATSLLDTELAIALERTCEREPGGLRAALRVPGLPRRAADDARGERG